jgi:hypothetical protein
MMRISEHGYLIITLAAAFAIFAQSNNSPVKSQNLSSEPDVRKIVEASIAKAERHWQARRLYTYVEHDQDQRRDSDGRVTSEDVIVSRTILVNRVPFEQLVEHNGQPPSSEEERKQGEKLDRLKRETPEQRDLRIRKRDEETTSLVREVPKAFDFQLVDEEIINGRAAYVLQATPRPGYHAQGKYGRIFAKVEGKLWIDKQDLGWIKADGQVTQPFSMGLFLARVLRGSRITMEQLRVDGGIWMPKRVEVRATARIFFVKSLTIGRVLTYSEYRLAGAGVSAAKVRVIP